MAAAGFNQGPAWAAAAPRAAWAFLEAHGWPLLALLLLAALLLPRLRAAATRLRPADGTKAAAYAEGIRRARDAQQAELERQRVERAERLAQQEQEEDARHRAHRLEELDRKATRLGFRPRGKGQRLGTPEDDLPITGDGKREDLDDGDGEVGSWSGSHNPAPATTTVPARPRGTLLPGGYSPMRERGHIFTYRPSQRIRNPQPGRL